CGNRSRVIRSQFLEYSLGFFELLLSQREHPKLKSKIAGCWVLQEQASQYCARFAVIRSFSQCGHSKELRLTVLGIKEKNLVDIFQRLCRLVLFQTDCRKGKPGRRVVRADTRDLLKPATR